PDLILISSLIPNEGEVKMFAELLKLGDKNKDSTHLIVGNDADLVALSIAARPVNNIYLLGRHVLLNINHLLRKVTKCSNLYEINQYKTRYDLVIMSIMGDNDYLPNMGYVTIETLFMVYSKYRSDGYGCI